MGNRDVDWLITLAQAAAKEDPEGLREIVERFRRRVEFSERVSPVRKRSPLMILLK